MDEYMRQNMGGRENRRICFPVNSSPPSQSTWLLFPFSDLGRVKG